MRSERVVCSQFDRHLFGGLGGQSLRFVDPCQLDKFLFGGLFQFLPFEFENCRFTVSLTADRDVFTQCHRDCSRYKTGKAGGEDRATRRRCAGNADNQSGR